MRLYELFDSKYEVELTSPADAEFKTEKGDTVRVYMNRFDVEGFEPGSVQVLEFSRNHSFSDTGDGDALKILSSVIEAVKMIDERIKPDYIVFSAKAGSSKASLYDRMVVSLTRSTHFSPLKSGDDYEDIIDANNGTGIIGDPDNSKIYILKRK